MLGHVGLNVPDLDIGRAYYDALTPLVGFESFLAEPDRVAYRPAAGKHGTYIFLYRASPGSRYSRTSPGLQHLAFMVPTRSAVDCVHAHVLQAGGEVLHAPRRFPEYPQPYYATFWLDPFGFMLEAVCHHDRA